MKFGIHLPQVGPNASRENILKMARFAEDSGFDSLWVSDHVVTPRGLESKYPYNATGEYRVPPDWDFLEPLTTLAFVAAATERVQLGTTVLVLPMRNPVVHAKIVSTIHALSGGRMILGVGAGWMREEFEALDADFENRGRVFDEYLKIVRGLWEEDNLVFRGETYEVHDLGFSPRPDPGTLPIWIGGHHRAALRRAATLGDGWHAVGVALDEIPEKWQQILDIAAENGRDTSDLTLSVRTGFRPGDADAVEAQMKRLVEMGIAHVVLDVPARSVDDSIASLNWFAEEVRPRLAQAPVSS
ncbi:MAG TPA: LLM class F420-dependent oxidoreductase [Dehalococcoidia bacterium]|nr:LLM class F420-dependent oxidoreductase [Dehalococcoidia bacterium]